MNLTTAPPGFSVEKKEDPPNSEFPCVSFTEEEIREIQRVGVIRSKAQQENPDNMAEWKESTELKINVGFEDMAQADRIGIVGEYAFSRYYDLPKPLALKTRTPNGDAGFDFVLNIESPSGFVAEGVTVDVKTSNRPEKGNFMHYYRSEIKADIFYLCLFDTESNDVYLRGFIPRVTLENAKVRRDIPQPAYYVHRSEAVQLPEPHRVTPAKDNREVDESNKVIANVE